MALAGPWVRSPGEGWFKTGYSHYRSADGFVAGEATGLAYRAHRADFYGEVGLPWDLQLVGSLPFVHAANETEAGTRYTHTWTGDLRLELDRRLVRDLPIAAGIEARVPTYRAPEGYTRVRGTDNTLLPAIAPSFPEIGERSVDLTAKLLVGAAPRTVPMWFTLEAGPRLRLGDHAEGGYAAASVGGWLYRDHAGLNLYASGNRNLPGPDDALPSSETLYVQGSAMLADFPFAPSWGVILSAGWVVLAEHASVGRDIGLSLYWHRRPEES